MFVHVEEFVHDCALKIARNSLVLGEMSILTQIVGLKIVEVTFEKLKKSLIFMVEYSPRS